ncbi:GNAT family N-acetyltransferase [Roseisalinus antarcticus]|uniref:GNAT family N-acetyltransferase n=1 Tax=Roseisalinus antarcticus TaxID=254357 RepID=UPI000A268854|nr:GNAT family N-acetyltransferase [Roseisalinus antarcticus]
MQQHPIFAEALAALGVETFRVCLGEARLLVVRRRVCGLPLTLSSRAEIPGPADGLRPLIVNAESAACGAALRAMGYRRIATPSHVALLDLAPAPEDLRLRLHGAWRTALRRAEAPGLNHAAFDPARHGWLLAREAAQRRRRRYRALPLGLTAAMAAVAPGAVRVLQSGEDAGILLVLHGDTATYHIGWSGPEARRRDSHRRLLWEAILWLQARGVRCLDLGQVDTETAPGLARFKIGTGALVRPLGGTWMKFPHLAAGRVSRPPRPC